MRTAISLDGTCTIGGKTYPAIGFGTYPLTGEKCIKAVSEALQQGYRIVDTATYYENFDAVAAAMQGWKREDIYLVSKVWHDSQTAEGVQEDLERTLLELDISYLDGYLIHWPNSAVSIEETLGAMEASRQEGKIRDIGLSNVSVNHLKRALEVGVPITWVQVEMHALCCDDALLSFCKEHEILVQAWRPLDQGRLCSDAMLSEIGERYEKSAGQVALRWIVQKGVLPLPGSANPKHIADNFDVFDFSLSAAEMERISERASAGRRFRLNLDHGLGFADEFDFTYEQCWPSQ